MDQHRRWSTVVAGGGICVYGKKMKKEKNGIRQRPPTRTTMNWISTRAHTQRTKNLESGIHLGDKT